MIYGIRFRQHDAFVVLQVMEREQEHFGAYQYQDVWRDAKVEDMLEVAIYCSPYASTTETKLNALEYRLSDLEGKCQ